MDGENISSSVLNTLDGTLSTTESVGNNASHQERGDGSSNNNSSSLTVDDLSLSSPGGKKTARNPDQLDWEDEEISSAMESLMPSSDPFYKQNFDVTDYINSLFPTEQSLSKLDECISQVKEDMNELDQEMGETVVGGCGGGREGTIALERAHVAIQELFTRIREIKAKTDLSESMVKEITRDIKQLDVAKKNLTTSITTLNHLHMLISGLEALSGLVAGKDYAQIANLLPGLLNVLEHFEKYMGVSQIKELADEVVKLKEELRLQVKDDFKDCLTGAQGLGGVGEVGEVCRVVSVLDPGLQLELSRWYVETQMAEYLLLYDDTQDDAWLDKIDNRYSWFRNRLVEFETKSAHLFPPEWDMGYRMTLEFCHCTKDMLDKVIQKRLQELDVKLLLHAIQRTKNFENLLIKRFPPKKVIKEETEEGGSVLKADSELNGIISVVFEKELNIYVSAQETNLQQFLDQCVRRLKEDGGLPKRELTSLAQPIPSSGDLFLFFKRTILQVNEVTTEPEKLLVEILPVFKRNLREYALKCLTAALPRIQSASAMTTTSGIIQSLLKEGEVARLSSDEHYLVCCILVTAEFCADTTEQLQQKLEGRITNPNWAGKADLSGEQEVFHNVTSSALAILVQDMESACDAALQTMTKMNWSTFDQTGDESPYVASIKTHLIRTLPPLRDYLSNARRYFLNLCSKFASVFVTKFSGCVLRCKPLSRAGADQLLLDCHSLKTFLLDLPSLDSLSAPKPPAVYTKPVSKGMNKVEMILKVPYLFSTSEYEPQKHQSRQMVGFTTQPPEGYVSNYLKLLPESSPIEFQRILEMKGLRRSEQSSLLELYRKRCGGKESAQIGGPNSLQQNRTAGGGIGLLESASGVDLASVQSLAAPLFQLASDSADSRIRKLEKLVKGKR